MTKSGGGRLKIAVIGTGISGMSAAWLLSQRHDVTVYERCGRLGGHSHTIDVDVDGHMVPVDTGFIVYNEAAYPNLTALFDHLDVPTQPSDMSFAVSLDDGRLEYSGTDLAGLLAQKRNIVRPRFWSMLSDIRRFYREAVRDLESLDDAHMTLGDYLETCRYGAAFRDDHLLPMAAAIWSAPASAMLDYPASSFIRFHRNHGLLQIANRPQWRTVTGGSQVYVEKLTRSYAHQVNIGVAARRIRRFEDFVHVQSSDGRVECFDHVVIATHADEALSLLDDASAPERELLGSFRYSNNSALLHSDPSFMPKRRAAWSSWNYIGRQSPRRKANGCSVSYWMNRLQNITAPRPLFVTLNPQHDPDPCLVIREESCKHPMFDWAALRAQRALWSLQGQRNTWFCGAYFGSGFHEDGLQAGLAVAEVLGGVGRPWTVADESGRIFIHETGDARPVRAA